MQWEYLTVINMLTVIPLPSVKVMIRPMATHTGIKESSTGVRSRFNTYTPTICQVSIRIEGIHAS